MGLMLTDLQNDLNNRIEAALALVRPFVESHAGNITFVKFEDGIVFVKLHGMCINCPASIYTISLGVERILKENVVEVKSVEVEDEE
jgi:Fe-S cluster biogenesis protein NfuA